MERTLAWNGGQNSETEARKSLFLCLLCPFWGIFQLKIGLNCRQSKNSFGAALSLSQFYTGPLIDQ